MSRTLPERAHLEFLTKESKDFLKAVKAGDAAARERLRTWGPADASSAPKLADCQHALQNGSTTRPKGRSSPPSSTKASRS